MKTKKEKPSQPTLGSIEKVLSDYILLEPEMRVENQVTKTGIHINKPKFQGVPLIGKVYAIGADVTTVKAGDRVVFKEPNPHGFVVDGIKLIPIRLSQIEAIVQ